MGGIREDRRKKTEERRQKKEAKAEAEGRRT
jgi:hypothetical protein